MNPMKLLVIMRGVPGSGKSTLAEEIQGLPDGVWAGKVLGYVGSTQSRHYELEAIDNEEEQYEPAGYYGIICSADYYFQHDDCEYNFDPIFLPVAHAESQTCCELAMRNQLPLIIIDNTNIKRKHFEVYLQKAKKHEYMVWECCVDNPELYKTFPDNDLEELAKVYAKRNEHNVPLHTIHRMMKEFEE